MAPFILKFKGNKSFVAFHNMNDGDSLTKTWKVCTKVAAHLEQGQRLENLSWRLWHLHNIMVETDNAKSKREFKKLSRSMGDKLDREKGKNIEELRAPGYKRTESSDKMRRRAEEIERLRDESSHSRGGMRRMQFTFSLDTPSPSPANPQKAKITVSTHPAKKTPVFKEPALRLSPTKASLTKQKTTEDKKNDDKPLPAYFTPSDQERTRAQKPSPTPASLLASRTSASAQESTSPTQDASNASSQAQQPSVRLPGLFSSNFGPTAMLYPSPSFAPSLSYGEDVTMSYAGSTISPNGGMGISRPTIELPLDELLEVDADSPDAWGDVLAGIDASQANEEQSKDQGGRSVPTESASLDNQDEDQKPFDLEYEMAQMMQAERVRLAVASSQSSSAQQQGYHGATSFYPKQSNNSHQRQIPTTMNPMALHHSTAHMVNNGNAYPAVNANGGRGTPGATAVPMSAPIGHKTECSNCGATHTPLWRRGLNDELNCNACGLYCKLHKRPRPKSMRSTHADTSRNNHTHSRSLDSETIGAKCFNCHTTATPLWRKDDEGKTVCNACGLYFKLHGTNRPLSMKSDVIRKRSRHEIRRAGFAGCSSETPSASPGASRRASPARAPSPGTPEEEERDESQRTPRFSYDYTSRPSQNDYTRNNSPPNDMLSSVSSHDHSDSTGGSTSYSGYFPGPYHPDYLYQNVSTGSDLHPIQTGDTSDYGVEDRGNKRRRLSSASYDSSSTPTDPPPSATSLHSSHTKSPPSSPSFPSYGPPYSVYTYQGFSDAPPSWTPSDRIHPPMALPEDAPMEYLHPPMVLPENASQPSSSASYPYLHPPMLPVEEAAMTYMHPPMMPQANSPIVGYTHPPMLPSYWNNDQSVTYVDTSNNSTENPNNMEMFDSMMNSLE